MSGTRLQRIKAIFIAASAIPAGPRREELLALECGQDAELRREVESLLAAKSTESAVDPLPSTISSSITEGPGTRIGPYKLLQQIGEGGFGAVFMADQERPVRRRVALKIIKLGMDTRRVVARFEAERQALAMMDHPHIARVLDAGATESGRPYFVMDLVKGDPITDYCDRNNLSINERIELFIQVCNAVQHAHTKGVIHRDLKPSNILVATQDGRPHAKVIDFGIAKATDHQLTEMTLFTEHKALIGTPAYMSPEQAEGSLDIDTRTDVYSLGVLLYELLTGSTPFTARELKAAAWGEMQRIIREVEPPKPSTRISSMPLTSSTSKGVGGGEGMGGSASPGRSAGAMTLTTLARMRRTEPKKLGLVVRGELDWIVMKALDKDRVRRYETANGFAADARRYLAGEPVVAAPPSMAYRMRKFIRLYKGSVIAASLIAAALTSGAIVSTGFYLGQRKATQRAETSRTEMEFQAYVAGLSAAQLAMAANAWPEARARLEQCPVRQRGWEWWFLKRRADSIKWALPNTRASAFSPDGKRIVTASIDNMVQQWDSHTGEFIGSPMYQRASVQHLTFSPDGRRIVADLDNETAQLWTAETCQAVGQPMRHEGAWSSPLFSPDGRWIMTSSGEGGAQIRDGATGQATGKPIAIQDWLHIAAFTTDGERIVVASGGSIAQLWNAATGEQIGKPMQHDAEVSTAHFSFDDKRVLTTSANNTARVWDAFTGDALGPPIRYEGAWDAVFSRDGMRLLTMSADNSARVWDATTGNAIGESMPHVAGLDNAIFSRDGQYILTSSRDHMARRWDATNGAAVGEPMHHEDGLTSAVFSPDGSQVLTTGRFSACLWNLDGRCVGKLDCNIMPREGAVSLGCSFSPEGSLLSAQLGPTLLVVSTAQLDWPVSKINATDDVAAELELVLGDAKVRMDGAPGPVRSPDGKRQVSVLPDGRLRIIDADSGREAAALRPEMPAAGVMFTSDGTRLVVTVKDAPALIWDARDPSARRADWDARADERRPAEDYIKELLRGPREIDELETAIRADKEIPPIRRLVALEVLREKVAQFRVEAKALFRTIAEDHIAPERIRAAVRAMTDLPPRVSESLLALAKDLEGDSGQLNQLAWKHVSEPGASPDRLELALDTARQALALAPTNPDVAKTLGAALYRHGDYADAIKTLEFGPKRIGEPRPVELACLAMSYHQLNQKTEAKSSILSLKQVVEVKNYWLVGTVDERGLLFKSRDDGETSEGEVILANDGQSFHGQWRTEGGGGWESFAGKRLVGAALDRFEGLWSTDWGTLLLFSDEEKLCGAYADESLVYEAFLLLNEPFPSLPDVGLYSTPDARRPASDE